MRLSDSVYPVANLKYVKKCINVSDFHAVSQILFHIAAVLINSAVLLYSQLSLSRHRLSRITAYLEEKF